MLLSDGVFRRRQRKQKCETSNDMAVFGCLSSLLLFSCLLQLHFASCKCGRLLRKSTHSNMIRCFASATMILAYWTGLSSRLAQQHSSLFIKIMLENVQCNTKIDVACSPKTATQNVVASKTCLLIAPNFYATLTILCAMSYTHKIRYAYFRCAQKLTACQLILCYAI